VTVSVILAHDFLMVRQGLAALLQSAPGIALLGEAGDANEAWRLIGALRPAVAILDLVRPGGTGIEIIRRIDGACLDTQVVLLTMSADPTLAQQAQAAGVAGYVLKDSSFDELILAVQTVAAGGTFITPSMRARLRALQRGGHPTVALSPREREVIRLIALGNSGKEIARALDVSPRTVETYRNRLMRKLDLHSMAQVVRYAVETGMLD
jgi:DNA-binding NarL/FixJ family response regulator